jgi:hypothetical protein
VSVDLMARQEAAYARLAESRRIGGALTRTRDDLRVHAALTRVVANGRASLRELGDAGDPYLRSHTRMYLAAAHFDLAAMERGRERRIARVEIGLQHATAAIIAALRSRTPFLPVYVLPWALVVLTGGLRSAEGAQADRIRKLIASCSRAIPRVEAQKRRAQARGARILFEGQLLFTTAGEASDRRQRTAISRRASGLVWEARWALLGAGDLVGADQAKRTAAEIDRSLS